MGYPTFYLHFLVVSILIIYNISGSFARNPRRLDRKTHGWINNTSSSSVGRRGGKIFMAYVTFPQEQCKSDTGDTGLCMKQSACSTFGGKDSGSCAFGYGTCCIITQKCSEDISTIRLNGTRLVQGSKFTELCRYEIPRQNNVCQIRLDFTEFMIDEGPEAAIVGDCVSDTLTISGNSNAMIGPLCGNLNGQHMYLSYGANDKINLDLYLTADMMQKWNIMVTMIKCDSLDKAPPGCLQYYTAQRGMVKSFNYNLQHQLNNQDYSVCVRANQGMKKITWKTCGNPYDFVISGSPPAIPLPPDTQYLGNPVDGSLCTNDWVMVFGANKYCGSGFPDSVATMSQPFMLQVYMNSYELQPLTVACPPYPPGSNSCPGGNNSDDENTGFCLAYAQTPY